MPLLSSIARIKKKHFFFRDLPKTSVILEIGCGDGWVAEYFQSNGFADYTGLDINPPADIVGDIRDWRQLGLQPESFDVIIAFEVLEHVDCLQDCRDLLVPGGKLLITTPLPQMDWLLKAFETLGLTQKRGTPHDNLVCLKKAACFTRKKIVRVGLLSQWAVFVK